jgi:hypothetical protein
MEADVAWTRRPDLIEGRLCGVRLPRQGAETSYALGKLYRDPVGLVFDAALGAVLRLATSSMPPLASSPESAPPGTEAEESEGPPRARNKHRRRRTVRFLDREEQKAARRNQAMQDEPRAAAESEGELSPVLTLQDFVAVCLYLARPSPGVGRVGVFAEGAPAGRP